MEITRTGTKASVKGPADWFSGAVRIDPLFDPNGEGQLHRSFYFFSAQI